MPELHRGRLAQPPRILAVRPLVREDLGVLKAQRVAPRSKIFRDTHHRLARLIASGLPYAEILRITGYSYQRLSTLKLDPAFQELVSGYRDKATDAWVNSQDEFYETSTSNMLRAERQIEEHLDLAEESGELVPLKSLLAITSDRADRFGYPKKKEINSNHTIDFAKRIESVMARSGRGSVIDARPMPLPVQSASIAPEQSPARTDPAPAPPASLRRF
jgi:hypothetical protein